MKRREFTSLLFYKYLAVKLSLHFFKSVGLPLKTKSLLVPPTFVVRTICFIIM
jgi:hypothetical protein